MRRATAVTIVASVALHGAIAAVALSAAHDKQVRRATTVALAEQEKKKPKPKEEPKPPPPPPPKAPPKIAPKVAPTPTAAPTPAAAPPPTAATSAPVASDIAMSNEVGMDLGTGTKPPGSELPKPDASKAPAAKPGVATPTKTPLKVDAPPPTTNDGGGCTEPPGKPEPSLKTDIEYTEEARAAGVEGRLVLEATVDADGNVTAVKVISGVDPALDATAIATVKTWRFKPAMACGKPVAGGTYRIARRFVLGD